jgi:hypothetical protein
MARPFKKGLSYFPLDVKFFDDPKIQELIMEVGYLGIVVYLRILTLVYQEGYYLEISVQSLARLIFRDIRGQNLTKVDRVIEVIYRIAECELIDSNLVAKGIITSSSIEKQWLISTARRRNIDKSKYWLLTQEEEQEALKCTKSSMSESARIMSKFINVDNNLVNVDNNLVNVGNNTQNKKENKIDKKDKYRIKDNQTIKEKKVGSPILNYYTTVLIDNNFISLYDLDIAEYNYFLGELATHYNCRKILSAIKYTIAEIKKRQDNIDDKFAYFKKSILNGLERLANLEKPIEKNLNKLFGFEEEQ